MKSLPVLKADVLFVGKGCPVCGGEKTKRARTCRACYLKIGLDATKAVDEFTETCVLAIEGNAAADKGGIERNMVFGPVFAQFRVDKHTRRCVPGNGIAPYLECMKAVQGGFLSMFVFGDDAKPGQTFSGLVELKTKQTSTGKVHYLRVQIVPDVRSNVKLRLDEFQFEFPDTGLPFKHIYEQGRRYSIGFVPA